MTTLFFTEEDIAELLGMDDAVTAVEECFGLLGSQKAVNQPRSRVRVDKLVLHVLSAGSAPLGYVGLKAYTTGPSGARFYVLLFEASEGALVAMMEADRLGQIRTGAASGVATKYMAREDARRVGIFGTGWQARSQLQAVAVVRPVESIAAYGRDESRCRTFCDEMSESLGVPVTPAARPEEVVEDADVVITATSAKEPVLLGEWLRPGQHVNAVGSNALRRREIDETAVTRASFIAVDSLDQAKIECGDLAAVVKAGELAWDRVQELSAVVSGRLKARTSEDDITLFESQGLAIEDVAAAKVVYEKARAAGSGRKLRI